MSVVSTSSTAGGVVRLVNTAMRRPGGSRNHARRTSVAAPFDPMTTNSR